MHHNTFHFATSNVTMAEKTPITAQEKGTIEALFQEGHSAREIGRRLGVSDSTVRYNLRKLKEYGSMDTYHDQVVHRRPPTEMIVHWSTVSKQLRPYSIHNHILDEVTSAKYLGVHIDSKVNFNAHVDATVKKANSTQAFLNRNFRHCTQKIKYIQLMSGRLWNTQLLRGTHTPSATSTSLRWSNVEVLAMSPVTNTIPAA